MLTLNIASAEGPQRTVRPPGTLRLTSKALDTSVVSEFPALGVTSTVTFKLTSTEPFDLDCLVSIGNDALEFRFTHLLPGDALNVLRHDASAFTATIFHDAPHPPTVTCMAQCADGTSEPGCVVCQSGTLKGKICC